MKCANCGAKLQVGSVYCSFCGKEAQIVPDYSILEDEILQEMLNGQEKNSDFLKESMEMASRSRQGREGIANTQPAGGVNTDTRPGQGKNAHSQPGAQNVSSQPGKRQNADSRPGKRQNTDSQPGKRQNADSRPGKKQNVSSQPGKRQNADSQPGKKQNVSSQPGKRQNANSQSGKKGGASRRKRKPIGWALAAILLMVFLLVDILFMLNHSRNNSYDYQLEQGEKNYDRRDYEDAEKFLLRAVELSDGQLEGHLLLAKVYRLQGKTGKAIETLQDIIQNKGKGGDAASGEDYLEAYRQLIQIYEEDKDYDAIYELYDQVGDGDLDIQQLFEEYQVGPPEFVQEEGVYEEMVSIEISSQPGCDIFYTTDGSDPKQGLEYQGPIQIEPGNMVRIRAISRNEHGVYSEESEGSFEIDLPKPDMPRVSPMGGSFYEPQSISVYVPNGCNVYYTWDGSMPSEASNRYMGPFEMPEGNNILSLILVDEYGRYSDVLKCNYIYFP